jgi:hypothetical protein
LSNTLFFVYSSDIYRKKKIMAIYLKKFENHTQYDNYINGSGAILPNVSICTTEGDVHYNPYLDPCKSEKVQTTYEWINIGGIKWATKNVGALTVTDYGQKFAWGETDGYTNDQISGECKTFSWVDYKYGNGTSSPSATGMTKYNSTDGLATLLAADDAATVNMGSGWRMPTKADFQTLNAATTSHWTNNYQDSGVAGFVLTANFDSSKVLFFPASGSDSRNGAYWSSSLSSDFDDSFGSIAYFEYGNDDYWNGASSLRYAGLSVRGVFGE